MLVQKNTEDGMCLEIFSSLPLVGPFSTSQFLDGDMREIRPL